MGNVTKKTRQGIAAIWLKHKRRKINSSPKILVANSGKKGRIRHRLVVEDKDIERRIRELIDLMGDYKKSIKKNFQEMVEVDGRIDYLTALQVTRPYREYKRELIGLLERLEEIKGMRKEMKRKARERARKIAGKGPRYVDAEVVSRDNTKTLHLPK